MIQSSTPDPRERVVVECDDVLQPVAAALIVPSSRQLSRHHRHGHLQNTACHRCDVAHTGLVGLLVHLGLCVGGLFAILCPATASLFLLLPDPLIHHPWS